MARIEELDNSDVDYTEKDHNDYDRHLEMLLKHKKRYEQALSFYEYTKDDYDQLNEDYLAFKKRTEENPLNEQFKSIQKQISEKAANIESNVYFRKNTKKQDRLELEELNEQRKFIQQRLDEDAEILENKRKNVDMRKKQMLSAQANMLALQKTYERERSEIRSFDDIIKGKRKDALLMEAEKLKHSVGDTIEFGCWPNDKRIGWTIIAYCFCPQRSLMRTSSTTSTKTRHGQARLSGSSSTRNSTRRHSRNRRRDVFSCVL